LDSQSQEEEEKEHEQEQAQKEGSPRHYENYESCVHFFAMFSEVYIVLFCLVFGIVPGS